MSKPFLRAAWRHLLMLNYEIDPAVLVPLVPRGTQLDAWNGQAVVSLVGFLFLDARVLGVPVPFHRNFEEINLRFYVRRQLAGESRRGVVFVREIVPKRAVALVARRLYNENYVAFPMDSRVELPGSSNQMRGHVEYAWRDSASRNSLRATFRGEPAAPADGSEEQFITEHYWGYVVQRDGSTVEYQVAHPPWRVWPADDAGLGGDVPSAYGPQFLPALRAKPRSAFVADGSAVTVFRGERLTR
jgi:uncharacterized protein YqjF (DUF2071 family)